MTNSFSHDRKRSTFLLILQTNLIYQNYSPIFNSIMRRQITHIFYRLQKKNGINIQFLYWLYSLLLHRKVLERVRHNYRTEKALVTFCCFFLVRSGRILLASTSNRVLIRHTIRWAILIEIYINYYNITVAGFLHLNHFASSCNLCGLTCSSI